MTGTQITRRAIEAYEMEGRRYREGSTPEQCMSVALDSVRPALQAEILRQAAEGWGDGHEGFPTQWLHDRADEIEAGVPPNWEEHP